MEKAIHTFIEHLQFEKRYSVHTIRAYSDDLKQLATYLQNIYGTFLVTEIQATYLRSWIACQKEQGSTGKTLNRKISTLKSFFKFLMRKEIVLKNPAVSLNSLKISKRLPIFIPQKDLDLLFEHVTFSEDWKGRTEKLFLKLLYQTGLRLSEAIHLKNDQVDKFGSTIKVLGKGNKERIVPCNKDLMQELVSYKESKNQAIATSEVFLFLDVNGQKLKPRMVWAMVHKYVGMVSTVQRKSPHVLRHSFATHLLSNGAELNAVKELLGHSSLASTQVYTHNTIEKLKDIFNKAHPKA